VRYVSPGSAEALRVLQGNDDSPALLVLLGYPAVIKTGNCLLRMS